MDETSTASFGRGGCMKARGIFGWIFAALWLGGIQVWVYFHESTTVFWLVLIAWAAIFSYTFWNRRATK